MRSTWLLDQFEAQANDRPKAIAIDGPDRAVTYRELHRMAAALAAQLGPAVSKKSAFLVVTDDRVLLAAALLAAIGTGWTCAPLSTDLPAARIQTAVDLLAPELVIRAAPPMPEGTVVPRPATDCRFVFFTSGTTGRPKGVLCPIDGVAQFVSWEIGEVSAVPGTRFTQLASPGYDAVLRDLLTPLVSGGTVCTPPGGRTPTGQALLDWLEYKRIEVVHCVPTLLRTLKLCTLTPAQIPALRDVLVAGEVLRPDDVRWWHAAFAGRIGLVNLYGPTETVMTKWFHRVSVADADRDLVPVGKPLPGVLGRIIDERGRERDSSEIGEVEIETPFVLGGYLDSPMDSFHSGPDGRLTRYRTGDLGRIAEDGRLDIVGRLDDQVKVNGVRIEPSDVEQALLAHPAVLDAVVVVRMRGDESRLCGYVVSSDGQEVPGLRRHLAALLPPALRPTHLVTVPWLPRMLTGKVDRAALPEPGIRAGSGEPPATGAEAGVAAIFRDHLSLSEVSRFDDLFELGGTSITALQVINDIRARFGVDIPIALAFEGFTPEGLGRYLETFGAAT